MELVICVLLIAGGVYLFDRRTRGGAGGWDQVNPGQGLTPRVDETLAHAQANAQNAAANANAQQEALAAANARIADLTRQLAVLTTQGHGQNPEVREEFDRRMAEARAEVARATDEAAKAVAEAARQREALQVAAAARARQLEALLPRKGALEAQIQALTRLRDETRAAFNAVVRLRLAIIGRWPDYRYAVGWELTDDTGESTRPFLPSVAVRVVEIASGEGQAVLSSRSLVPGSYPDVMLLTPEQTLWRRQLETYTTEGQALYNRLTRAESDLTERQRELEGINRELARGGTNVSITPTGKTVAVSKSLAGKDTDPGAGSGEKRAGSGLIFLR